eukprot:1157822-Pelagomonas_calceolata.AAC.24
MAVHTSALKLQALIMGDCGGPRTPGKSSSIEVKCFRIQVTCAHTPGRPGSGGGGVPAAKLRRRPAACCLVWEKEPYAREQDGLTVSDFLQAVPFSAFLCNMPSVNDKVLSYGDSCLRKGDADLLKHGQWLNDQRQVQGPRQFAPDTPCAPLLDLHFGHSGQSSRGEHAIGNHAGWLSWPYGWSEEVVSAEEMSETSIGHDMTHEACFCVHAVLHGFGLNMSTFLSSST